MLIVRHAVATASEAGEKSPRLGRTGAGRARGARARPALVVRAPGPWGGVARGARVCRYLTPYQPMPSAIQPMRTSASFSALSGV